MKKILIACFFIGLGILLNACKPIPYSFDYDEMIQKVIGVEYIRYENPDQVKFSSQSSKYFTKLKPFDISKMKIGKSLEKKFIPGFVERLVDIPILFQYYASDSPEGLCMRILYDNGDFMILSGDYKNQTNSGYVGTYSSNGDVVNYIGCLESHYYFSSLQSCYFDTVIV